MKPVVFLSVKTYVDGGGSLEQYERTNSMAFSPHANYTDRRPPLVDEFNANFLLVEG
jgi:hypothetical protein